MKRWTARSRGCHRIVMIRIGASYWTKVQFRTLLNQGPIPALPRAMPASRAMRWIALQARFALAISLCAIATTCIAADPADLARCAAIASDSERLQCYDDLGRRAPGQEPLQGLAAKQAPAAASASLLSARWELDPEAKQGVWNVRPHQPFFLLFARYGNNPNDSPQSPTQFLSQSAPLEHTEAEFQLSFKVKAWQNILSSKGDLWIA